MAREIEKRERVLSTRVDDRMFMDFAMVAQREERAVGDLLFRLVHRYLYGHAARDPLGAASTLSSDVDR